MLYMVAMAADARQDRRPALTQLDKGERWTAA